MNRKVVDKFFINQVTPDENRKVLEWFGTSEGFEYLQKRLDVDAGFMNRRELEDLVPELDSEKLFSAIQREIHNKPNLFLLHRANWVEYAVKVAAAVLVIMTAFVFSMTYQGYVEEKQIVEQQSTIFQTQDEENRTITLVDGSKIRMNSNSEITVSANYLQGTREITLSGEAYFDVEHNPDQPFIIHANQSSVEVLGTAFNIRSIKEQENVQVAVVEGRVSFKGAESGMNSEQLSVILSKNQYGYLDLVNWAMDVDDLAIENYLAWKNGGFNFKELSMQQVCTQLSRIYNIDCQFTNSQIREMNLTANFSNESLEKTLEVISMTLEVRYKLESDKVLWNI